MFGKFIGRENVKATTCFGEDVLNHLQTFIERNGKPCCINLITEKDIKFLKNLEKKKIEAPLGEEHKDRDAQIDHEDDEDEITKVIKKEEEEARKREEEEKERKKQEVLDKEAKKIKDD